MHVDDDALTEYLPATQAAHVDSEDAPSVGEYLPAQTVTKENRRVSGIVYADTIPATYVNPKGTAGTFIHELIHSFGVKNHARACADTMASHLEGGEVSFSL